MGDIKRMRFWGTSAGEGSPSPFCRCRVCEYARKNGGKDIRTRTAFRIDEDVMIDVGADYLTQSIKYNEDLFDVKHVLYSHTHNDHFNNTILRMRYVALDRKPEGKINLYFSPEGVDGAKSFYTGNEAFLTDDFVEFHKLDFYKTYTVGKYKVTPLKGHHHTDFEENAANYIIEFPSGKIMYYALDSGEYFEETFEYLKNVKIDLLIGECTFPIEDNSCKVHMNLVDEEVCLNRLFEQGSINKDTVIYLTHICPMEKTHKEIEKYWNELDTPYKVNIAYDGLSIDAQTDMFTDK